MVSFSRADILLTWLYVPCAQNDIASLTTEVHTLVDAY